MDDFPRIKRLPPYIFSITDALKKDARARGEDIIDFGMGNTDQPTPKHIVDKLIETVQRGDTHRYSQSKGIPRLRQAICNWYKERFDVDLDAEKEAIVTLGSKEGIAHLAMAITFSKNSRSTHCVVGFPGKFSTSTFGFGQLVAIAFSSSAKKSTPGASGTCRTSASAMTKP